jgi:hypothetical protein
MTSMEGREPPDHPSYSLEEALELLADLEDAQDALLDSGHLTVVAGGLWDVGECGLGA